MNDQNYDIEEMIYSFCSRCGKNTPMSELRATPETEQYYRTCLLRREKGEKVVVPKNLCGDLFCPQCYRDWITEHH